MLIYADARVRLEADGLTPDLAPLVLTARCQCCQQVLYVRTYAADDFLALDAALERHIQAQAWQDADLGRAHVCTSLGGERC